jgi:hypothetical protein
MDDSYNPNSNFSFAIDDFGFNPSGSEPAQLPNEEVYEYSGKELQMPEQIEQVLASGNEAVFNAADGANYLMQFNDGTISGQGMDTNGNSTNLELKATETNESLVVDLTVDGQQSYVMATPRYEHVIDYTSMQVDQNGGISITEHAQSVAPNYNFDMSKIEEAIETAPESAFHNPTYLADEAIVEITANTTNDWYDQGQNSFSFSESDNFGPGENISFDYSEGSGSMMGASTRSTYMDS